MMTKYRDSSGRHKNLCEIRLKESNIWIQIKLGKSAEEVIGFSSDKYHPI